ncbi:MAG: hypothetical protein JSW14_00645 [Candidatus Bathyarchaeum sp.]|nr:MAG: hypothetical protein JSW14_00645 [Candidatus Bathyarchaeum sp.]
MINSVHKKRSSKGGVSPVISTVVITGAMIAIVSVALVFANNFLWSQVAEGEFNSSKQLMHTAGLQIDDVAWTVGRTETIRYASQYGDAVLEPSVLNYVVTVETNEGTNEFSNETAILMFKVPTSKYSVANDYWERVFPSEDESLTLQGTSAPVARVFVVEKLPMYDGSYIRVVVAPAIRVLFSSINASTSTYYVKMYLPVLEAGEAPRLSQSITLTGTSVEARTLSNVTSIDVSVSFPRAASPENFDSAFFNFPFDSEEIPVPSSGYDNVVFELYLSEVSVEFGITW